MNPQTQSNSQPVVTMFLKPSFLVTAQSGGLMVAVSIQRPVPNQAVRN